MTQSLLKALQTSAVFAPGTAVHAFLYLRPISNLQDYIGTLPAVDRAEAFGQHPNADIAYQIEDSWLVLESLLSLQPQTALAAGGRSREDTVGAICADLLEQVHTYASLYVSAHLGLLPTIEAPIKMPHGVNCPFLFVSICHCRPSLHNLTAHLV